MSAVSDPAGNAFAITPGTALLSHQARGIYVGTGGDVEIVTPGGQTIVFSNAVSGSVLPVMATKVLATNTTASDLVGLY